MNNYCILTTINPPSPAVEKLSELFGDKLIVVGDKKTPSDWKCGDARFIPIEESNVFSYSSYAPLNHYARKNIGYLYAIRNKADLIYDTDDDNCPNDNWKIRTVNCLSELVKKDGWFNIYGAFNQHGWPRGYSLNHVHEQTVYEKISVTNYSPIQQGMVDGEPDVDAIYRLTQKQILRFEENKSLTLAGGSWCPFNSQTTWFFPEAYPLLYLPSYASFRMTDIWRSFVAQRCLWKMGHGITFHSPSEVFQERNPHDLIKDFKDEIEGYLHNHEIVELLSKLELSGSLTENMLTCYQALVDKNFLPEMEIRSLKSWLTDYERIKGNIY